MPKEPKSDRTPAQEAFDKWYSDPENKHKMLKKSQQTRKERYNNDLVYRETIKESVYKRRREYRAKNPVKRRGCNAPKRINMGGREVTLLGTGIVSERFGVSRLSILRWEKSGVLPRLFIRDECERRWYPEEYVIAVTNILSNWRESEDKSLISLTSRVKEDRRLFVDLPETFSIGETND